MSTRDKQLERDIEDWKQYLLEKGMHEKITHDDVTHVLDSILKNNKDQNNKRKPNTTIHTKMFKGENIAYLKFHCSNCGKRVFAPHNYCSLCGQGIDWSDY